MGEAAAVTAAPAALLEALDRDGSVRQAWRIERWPVTIGRALDNDVVLTDPHVAPHHARIDFAPVDAAATAAGDGAARASFSVTAGETRNGLSVGTEHLAANATRTVADTGRDLDLHVARTALRLRLASHAVAPELPLAALAGLAGGRRRGIATAGLAALLLAAVMFSLWLGTDPDNFGRTAGVMLLLVVAVGALWCGGWALVSKLFARRGHLAWHVRVAVVAALVLIVLTTLPPLLAFSLSWPWVTDFSFVALYATGAFAIYLHLLAVEPKQRGLLRAVAATGFAVAVALSLWFNVQRTGRPGEELYMNHLFPPALRLARAKPVDRFVDGLAPVQAILDRAARETGHGDDDASDEGDEE